MSRVFLINVEAPEIRVAQLRSGELFDYDVERDGRLLGNIYKGIVENIVPGMDAAFVDIGLKRNALLSVDDVIGSAKNIAIASLLKPRQEVLVQIARPPVGTKGARVTMRLSIPGRFFVLSVGSDALGVSKRIESKAERSRLRAFAVKLRPLHHGIIIRTEAAGASETDLHNDLSALLHQMQAVVEQSRDAVAPALLYEDLGILGRVVRDRVSDDVTGIYIDHPAIYDLFLEQMRSYAPHLCHFVQLYGETQPIFERFGVSKNLETAAGRVVPLQSGGSLVIDEVEALTAIDVNTGSHVGRKGLSDTVLATNLEAAREIARQIRLRDMGGIVVVDFIDMERAKDRAQVLNAFECALQDDKGRSKIVQISPSGLVEMTRRREGQSLQKILAEPCPYCHGAGFLPRVESIAIEARRRARKMILKNPRVGLLVTLHPETACEFLGESARHLLDLELETGGQIRVCADENVGRSYVQFERIAPKLPPLPALAKGAIWAVDSSTRFYPEADPCFFVAAGTLVWLESVPRVGADNARILVEIVAVNRHFACGRATSG